MRACGEVSVMKAEGEDDKDKRSIITSAPDAVFKGLLSDQTATTLIPLPPM